MKTECCASSSFAPNFICFEFVHHTNTKLDTPCNLSDCWATTASKLLAQLWDYRRKVFFPRIQ